jgi:hypothetical protein
MWAIDISVKSNRSLEVQHAFMTWQSTVRHTMNSKMRMNIIET